MTPSPACSWRIALQKEQAGKRAELDAVSGGKWVYPHGDAATRVRDAVNAELKSRGMQPDAKIFCELLNVEPLRRKNKC